METYLKDTEIGLEGLGGFNSEPNKRLRLPSPLASRGAGIEECGIGGLGGIECGRRSGRGKTRGPKVSGGGLEFVV